MANAQRDDHPSGDRKFFFDLHDFSDPNEKIDKNAPPPPPTYTQEELDTNKQTSFDQGRLKGLNDAQASREQAVTSTLQQIAAQFALLFAAEQEREIRYEQEAVSLTLKIFEKLFPTLNEKIGPLEAEHAVRKVLKSAAEQSEITIRIHPDFVDEIEAIVAPFRNKEVNPPSFHIVGDAALGLGDCRLSWADGGAVRDAEFLSRAIMNSLMDLLPEPEEPAIVQQTEAQNNDINEEVRAESLESGVSDAPPGEINE